MFYAFPDWKEQPVYILTLFSKHGIAVVIYNAASVAIFTEAIR